MTTKNSIILSLILIFSMVPQTGAQELTPITRKCIHTTAHFYKVPVAALYGIFATEGGTVGEYSSNTVTRDNGPMQINTLWLEDLKSKGITEENLRNNGCLNVFVSGWILKGHLDRTGDIWQAIGDYHNRTKELGDAYRVRVLKNLLSKVDYDVLLAKANQNVRPPQ